jgi:predicted ribosome quality control (RQC) complex YloA/Tae2 family protein
MADLQVGQVDDPARLLPVIQQVYGHINRHEWKPYVTFDKNAQVEYFAPIALTHLPQSEPVESISMAVEAHFSAAANEGETDAYQAARFPVQLAIEQALNRLERRNKKLDQDEASLEDPEIYKQKGEATLSYSYQVKPRQTSLEVIWTDEEPLVIELDPSLSASQNAQRYFDRYQKAKRAAEIIPRQRKRIALQQEYLNQLSLDLEMAETRPEIDAVAVSLQSAGFDKDFRKKNDKKATKKAAPAASQPRRFISPDGFTVWVGRNATQNHDLTFGRARPEDIWLHARGVPGSHVVIVAPDERPPKSTIEWAAGIAAYYSKAKKAGRAIVSYTRKKYVRPIKGAPPGLVRVHNESTIRVAPFKPDEA